MNLQFVQREELAPTIWEYSFTPERPLKFVAGQYVDIILDGVEADPRGNSRVFTITSQPGDPTISFVVKIPKLHSPYKEVLAHLVAGTTARCNESMGDLILPKDARQPLVFIANGIGIASFASILGYLTRRREEREIYLFYCVRSAREQIYTSILNAYPLALKTVTIAPNRMTAEQIRAATPPDALLYLSGSQPFVEELRTGLEYHAVPRSQIVFDYFDGYAVL